MRCTFSQRKNTDRLVDNLIAEDGIVADERFRHHGPTISEMVCYPILIVVKRLKALVDGIREVKFSKWVLKYRGMRHEDNMSENFETSCKCQLMKSHL